MLNIKSNLVRRLAQVCCQIKLSIKKVNYPKTSRHVLRQSTVIMETNN